MKSDEILREDLFSSGQESTLHRLQLDRTPFRKGYKPSLFPVSPKPGRAIEEDGCAEFKVYEWECGGLMRIFGAGGGL